MTRFQKFCTTFNPFGLGALVTLLVSIVFVTPEVNAVVLAWPPNPEANISGYRVYYGTSTGNYSQTLDVGNVTNVSISALVPGTTYFFSVSAYNSVASESVLSGETSFTEGPSEIRTSGVLSNGSCEIKITGGKGRTNIIQVSNDLKTWTNLTNIVNSTGSLVVNDSAAAGVSQRFYRVLAETYYLSNVVGFANITVPQGYSIIANSFVPNTNTVATVFSAVPGGTTIYKFQPLTGDYAVNSYDSDFQEWQAPNQPFGNGEAAFILNPTANNIKLTFAGRVPQGQLTRLLPAGYSMVGSMTPMAGLLQTDLSYRPTGGETVFLFRNGGYLISQFDPDFQQWDSEPQVKLGEGFFLLQTTASGWQQSFVATY